MVYAHHLKGSPMPLRALTLASVTASLTLSLYALEAAPQQGPAGGAQPAPAAGRASGRASANDPTQDWANLGRYRAANAALGAPTPGQARVVFMGDSITDSWARQNFFPGKPYVGRGISGQTTPQMLVRFRQDVVALQPRVVVILAGTNDIAGNTGPSTIEMIADNLMSMADIARASGIRVVLASVLPASDFPWRRGLDPGPKIVELNRWIKDYAARSGFIYLDYHSALVDDKLGMRVEHSKDGVHPTPAGYAVMAPLAEKAIAAALGGR
jgi:lysophospholipase L1-like esterase